MHLFYFRPVNLVIPVNMQYNKMYLNFFPLQKIYSGEPAVSVMAMSLDSHVVDRGLCPGPGGLKLTPGECARVPKIQRGEWRRRDCSMAMTPGVISHFLSLCLCLSDKSTHPIAKTSQKNV